MSDPDNARRLRMETPTDMVVTEVPVSEGTCVGLCHDCQGEVRVEINFASAIEPLMATTYHHASCSTLREDPE